SASVRSETEVRVKPWTRSWPLAPSPASAIPTARTAKSAAKAGTILPRSAPCSSCRAIARIASARLGSRRAPIVASVSVRMGIPDPFPSQRFPVHHRAARLGGGALGGLARAVCPDVEPHRRRRSAPDEAGLLDRDPPGPVRVRDEPRARPRRLGLQPRDEAPRLVEGARSPARLDPLGREFEVVDAHVAVLADVDAEHDLARGGRTGLARARDAEGEGDHDECRERTAVAGRPTRPA